MMILHFDEIQLRLVLLRESQYIYYFACTYGTSYKENMRSVLICTFVIMKTNGPWKLIIFIAVLIKMRVCFL